MDSSDYTLKIVVLGDMHVGKTTILQRYITNSYSEKYESTIGCNFVSKSIQLSINGKDVVVTL